MRRTAASVRIFGFAIALLAANSLSAFQAATPSQFGFQPYAFFSGGAPGGSFLGVAVAEIDYQDTWQRSLISAVTVSSDRIRAEQVLQAVERDAVDFVGPNLVDVTLEWLD